MTVTRIKDIAAKIGISNQAVSAVLNGRNNCRVSPERRAAILRAAQEMNYRPNAMAAGLRKGGSMLIGVLIDSGAGYRSQRILREIERSAAAAGYRVVTSFTHDNLAGMVENCSHLLTHGVPGVICLAHDYPEQRSAIAAAFGGDDRVLFLEPPEFPDARFVATSRRAAFTALFRESKARGEERFGFIHANSKWWSEQRLQEEIREAAESVGMALSPADGVEYPPDAVTIEAAGDFILEHLIQERRPRLVFSDDAEHALYMQNRLIDSGWRIPEELRFFGGNGDAFFRYAWPRIDSFDPDYRRIADTLLSGVIDREHFVNGTVIESRYPGAGR